MTKLTDKEKAKSRTVSGFGTLRRDKSEGVVEGNPRPNSFGRLVQVPHYQSPSDRRRAGKPTETEKQSNMEFIRSSLPQLDGGALVETVAFVRARLSSFGALRNRPLSDKFTGVVSKAQIDFIVASLSRLDPEALEQTAVFVRAKLVRPGTLPDSAPRLWSDAKEEADKLGRDYTPADHLKAHYSDWLDGVTLSRADYGRLDPAGAKALANWLRYNEMPAEVYVPTLSEALEVRQAGSVEDAIRRGSRLAQRERRRKRKDLGDLENS